MTPTAIELWNDNKFIEKRIDEQGDYIFLLSSEQFSDRCTRPYERYRELMDCAKVIQFKLEERLQELNKQ